MATLTKKDLLEAIEDMPMDAEVYMRDPEVKKVWISDNCCCISNSMTIHPNAKLSITVHFE